METCKKVTELSALQSSACASSKVSWLTATEQFTTLATELSWNLLTTAPPLVAACPDTRFCNECHEKEPPPLWDDRAKDQSVIYYRPVLYHSCEGKVARPGWVRTPNLAKNREELERRLPVLKEKVSKPLVDVKHPASPSTCLIHSKEKLKASLSRSGAGPTTRISSPLPKAMPAGADIKASFGAESNVQLRQSLGLDAPDESTPEAVDEPRIPHINSLCI